MESLFETATREKLRFETERGPISVEDLWDLPLTSKSGFDLDTVAKAVNRDLKDSQEESFVKPSTTKSSKLELKLELCKFIIKVKIDEEQARKDYAEKSLRRKKLIEALQSKEEQNLMNMSIDQIKEELEKL